MSINKLPIEILEKIIIEAEGTGEYNFDHNGQLTKNKVYLPKYALVCRKWTLIANSYLWKEVYVRGGIRYNVKENEFKFYKYIKNPGYVCGKYIQKLTLNSSKLWPICIVKIIQNCPNIVDLTINNYRYIANKGEGKVNNFLEKIQTLLPKLKRLDIRFSQGQISDIETEKLIKDRKDLQILATRNCKKYYFNEHYNGKEWKECITCESQANNSRIGTVSS